LLSGSEAPPLVVIILRKVACGRRITVAQRLETKVQNSENTIWPVFTIKGDMSYVPQSWNKVQLHEKRLAWLIAHAFPFLFSVWFISYHAFVSGCQQGQQLKKQHCASIMITHFPFLFRRVVYEYHALASSCPMDNIQFGRRSNTLGDEIAYQQWIAHVPFLLSVWFISYHAFVSSCPRATVKLESPITGETTLRIYAYSLLVKRVV